jgi:aminoglycoside phosphotransferase (APT) family kinase protein
MRLPDLEALAARIVPGSGRLSLRDLSEGPHNLSFEAERERVRYVLRLARDAASAENLAFEGPVWQEAYRAGLAPEPLYIDKAQGVLLYRWVDGENWTALEVQSPARIDMVARLIAKIQALPIPATPRRLSPADWVSKYRRELSVEGALDASLFRIATGCFERLASLPKLPQVLAHSDLHRLNLVAVTPAAMPKVLDWEYVHLTCPYWDVAGWSATNDFDAPATLRLLEAYLERPADPEERSRLGELAWLYDYVCWLWIKVHVRLTGSAASAALADRAELLSTRMRSRAPTMAN